MRKYRLDNDVSWIISRGYMRPTPILIINATMINKIIIKMKSLLGLMIIGLMMIFLISGCTQIATTGNTIQSNKADISLGSRNKTSGCHLNLPYPDFDCTPGHSFPYTTLQVNGRYVEEPGGVIVGDICESGYTKNVRNVPTALKDQVYSEYGIASHKSGEYEVDHIISLELGGDNDIANLWPEPASPTPGFHEKDKIENLLHDKVCHGEMTLQQAQYDIVHNWTKWI